MENIKTEDRTTVVVYAHPYNKSLAHAGLEAVIKGLEEAKKPYKVIDLYKDKFDPVMSGKELSTYSRGTTTNVQVLEYQKLLLGANHLVLVYPIWWGARPAILQGFFDKVFLLGEFWESKTMPVLKFPYLSGTTSWIERVDVFTTLVTPKLVAKSLLKNGAKNVMVDGTLKALGMKNIKWHCVYKVSSRAEEQYKNILDKIYKIILKNC